MEGGLEIWPWSCGPFWVKGGVCGGHAAPGARRQGAPKAAGRRADRRSLGWDKLGSKGCSTPSLCSLLWSRKPSRTPIPSHLKVPAVLAEGWKEANILIGALREERDGRYG